MATYTYKGTPSSVTDYSYSYNGTTWTGRSSGGQLCVGYPNAKDGVITKYRAYFYVNGQQIIHFIQNDMIAMHVCLYF